MNNYFANIEAIAHGKGSSQARNEGCLVHKEGYEEKPDWAGLMTLWMREQKKNKIVAGKNPAAWIK